MKATVAILDKCDEDAIAEVVSVLAKDFPDGNMNFTLATSERVAASKNVNALWTSKAASVTAVGAASQVPKHETQMLNTQGGMVAFDGTIYSPGKVLSAEFIAEKIQGDYEKAFEEFFGNVEGDFSLLAAQKDRLIASRDPVGVQPLYYGENDSIAALASNRKTLWNLGIAEPKSFPPGHLGIVTKEGFKLKPVQFLTFNKPKPISMDLAAKKLQELLEYSIQIRVSGLEKVAVAFSGGVDSSIVAALAKKRCADVNLVHVSLEGQPETEEAEKAAEQLELSLQVHLYTEADLEKVIPKVVQLIEEKDPIKTSVGVPFYWNAQKASEAGYRVLLAGQGADELFGGYKRYLTEYLSKGDEAVRKTMFHDVSEIHESNIERDEKICSYHNVELRLPFASFPFVQFAMSLPTKLKLENNPDSLRKLVLRRTAQNLGLPRSIADKPKKAVQYSTGINNALKRLAKKRNLTIGEYVNRIFQEEKDEIIRG
jgi:asparagine synthase (glutamine-hydrolysing)